MAREKEVRQKLYFETHLVEHCNLNCKGCAHFSPLAEKKFAKLNCFLRDIKRIKYIARGELLFVKLLGGEPLLHPQINEFILGFREIFPNTPLRLLTNGILLPTMESDFWNVCREGDVILEITKYPIAIDYVEIHNVLEKNGAKFVYRGNTDEEEKKFRHLCLDLKGQQNNLLSFEKCTWGNGAICLSDGKLFSCPIPAYIGHFNNYFEKNIPICEDDYVDIYKTDNVSEILERLSKPMKFCRYCNVEAGGVDYNTPYELSKREIAEWIM